LRFHPFFLTQVYPGCAEDAVIQVTGQIPGAKLGLRIRSDAFKYLSGAERGSAAKFSSIAVSVQRRF
jgi:hypothetical protein